MKKMWNLPPALEKHKTTILVSLGLVAMLLIVLPGLWPKEETSTVLASPEVKSADAYAEELSLKLSGILKGIDGVGEVKVLITMEKGEEKIYATERQSGSNHRTSLSGDAQKSIESTADQNENYLLVRSQGGAEQPVLLRVMEPTVRGAVILCEGAGNPVVRESVLSASKAVLGITTNRISVQKLSGR